jgi:hypothetical protein
MPWQCDSNDAKKSRIWQIRPCLFVPACEETREPMTVIHRIGTFSNETSPVNRLDRLLALPRRSLPGQPIPEVAGS